MSYANDAQVIRTTFNTEWPVQQPTVPYYFGGTRIEPPSDSPWVLLDVMPGEQRQVSMGSTRRFRRVGLIEVRIYVPAGSGDGLALELGDSVGAIFNGRTISGVICRATSVIQAGPDGAWMQYNASTPYQADSII
jgi:hypothetical protein